MQKVQARSEFSLNSVVGHATISSGYKFAGTKMKLVTWCSRALFTVISTSRPFANMSDMESPYNTGDDLQSVVRNRSG